MLYQLLSTAAAVVILVAYAGLQTGRLRSDGTLFCLTNCVCSGILAWIAVVDRRAGFIVLEGTWSVISLLPLLRRRARG